MNDPDDGCVSFDEATSELPAETSAVARAVETGLLGAGKKSLPSWLLYDAAGCDLYEKITVLPEYYLTRTEAEIFATQGEALVRRACEGASSVSFAEIGAGTATKTELLLAAATRVYGRCTYLACDIAPEAIDVAAARIRARFPSVDVRTAVGTHADACASIAALPGRQVLMFIGSSIGNYDDAAATALLRGMRGALRDDAMLILGTDLKKDPAVLVPAYDDAQGVTAAFSLNMLTRLNRELGADFDVDAFRHVASWDEAASNIEVHIEARRKQTVHVRALGRDVSFDAGERIHTETCAKYDAARVDRILAGAGFARVASFVDGAGRFAVQLARAVVAS